MQAYTRLDLPGDRRLEESIDWSKQNLADSVQVAEDLEVRETNSGANYPAPEGRVGRARFLGAGFPDYQWLFGTDGEFTAFASVAAGQFGPIKDHLRALRDVSEADNASSGKVVHEVVTDGSVFFGSDADDGNTDETAKFPSAVALIWRWTGNEAFRDEMYAFCEANMRFIFRELDEDGDLWPEGLGNVEREGMGEEKLDNAVYTLRGLRDLADMARSKGDEETARWAEERADEMARRFGDAWWMEGVPQHADSLENPGNDAVQQRHWIGLTPMDVELVREDGTRPGLALRERANPALDRAKRMLRGRLRPLPHGRIAAAIRSSATAVSEVPAEKNTYTLNTAIMAVAEGNYGRLGVDQQQRFTSANADSSSPTRRATGRDARDSPLPGLRPLRGQAPERAGHGPAGVGRLRHDLARRPPATRRPPRHGPRHAGDHPPGPLRSPISGENIRLAGGSVSVSAEAGDTYTTVVSPDVALQDLTVGHVLPRMRGGRPSP